LSAKRKMKPTTPLKATDVHMAVGMTRWASVVSSARLAAASKPTMTTGHVQMPSGPLFAST